MEFEGDGSSYPESMTNCTLFADDAPSFAKHCPNVYEQTLLFTASWDVSMDVAVELFNAGDLEGRYTASLHNEGMERS